MIVGAVEPAAWSAPLDTKPTALTTPLAATDASLANVFSGNNIPTSIKLKELTPDWRAMSTNGQLEIGNFQAFITSFGGGSFATSYYTKGQTIVIGAETYIVAYSLLTIVDKVSPEVSLNLSLLNLKTIGSMSNIRAFNTVQETKVLEKQLAALQLANVLDPTKEKPPVEAPVVEPCVAPPAPKPVMRKKRRAPRKNFRRSTRRINR